MLDILKEEFSTTLALCGWLDFFLVGGVGRGLCWGVCNGNATVHDINQGGNNCENELFVSTHVGGTFLVIVRLLYMQESAIC